MEEQTTEAVEEAADPAAQAPETETTAEPETGDEVAKWKALARKNEAAAKRNAEAAAKWQEHTEGQRSEAEKTASRIAELESQLAAREADLLRTKIAAEKGLEPELAETLSGSTAEEMAEHADRLLAAIQRRYAPKTAPKPEATGAGATGESGEPADPLALAAAVRRR